MYKKLLVAATGLALMQAGNAFAADTVKVASFVSPKSLGVTKVIKPWIERVKAEVGDKVDLKGYWGGSLGKSPVKQYELVKNGVADVAWILPGYTSGQFPEMQIAELPFLVKDANEAGLVVQGLYEAGLLTGLDDIKFIGAWASEPSALFLSKPAQTIEDLKNLKIRSAGAVSGRWLTEIGAVPQTMSAPKMSIALNRGTLDGGLQGWTGMRTFKALNLVTHAMDLPLGAIPFFLGMNKKTWDRLPAEVRDSLIKQGGNKIVRDGAVAYTSATTKIIETNPEAKKITVVKPSGPAFDAAAEKANAAVRKWWIEKTANGQAVYDKALEIIAKARKDG